MADGLLWMPSGLDEYAKAEYVDLYPDDPHMQAAAAWEDWAAQQDDPEPGTTIRSVSTGAQSVTFDGPQSARGAALERAAWHRARARVYSVEVGPKFAVASEYHYLTGVGESTFTADDSGDESFWQEDIPR